MEHCSICMYSVKQYVLLSLDGTRKSGSLTGTLIDFIDILSASDQQDVFLVVHCTFSMPLSVRLMVVVNESLVLAV